MNIALFVLAVSSFIARCDLKKRHQNTCGGCLLLSPYIKQGSNGASRARNLSQVDPALFFDIKSHSGFINVNEKYNSNLFFWFFPTERLEDTPWIIWLGGGPGITSIKGLFEIMGPLKVKNGQVKLRYITWASDYSLLFLDNPVGAGFSFTESEDGYLDNQDDVGAQMLVFLQQFLQVFPELQQAPLFLTGHSYAGKYVPALAIQIHRNKLKIRINLRGIAMGNALIDPLNMMLYSQLCSVLGVLDDSEIDELKEIEESALRFANEGRMVDAANKFNETIEFIRQRGVNIYNFVEEKQANKAPDFEIFLNRKDIRERIHVGNVTFYYDNQKVYRKMLPDIMNSTKPFVEELLEDYGVMSYSGQLDVIIAYSLSRNMFKTLNWSRRSAYVNAPRKRINDGVGNTVAKSGGNFVDVLIRNAGHGAPVDQPEVSKYIIDNFIEQFI